MWDGFNKRKFPRISVQCEITILIDGKTSSLKAITENLGLGGVCVILNEELERFSKCKVQLSLKGKKHLVCDGKIVWIVPTRDSDKGQTRRFDTGIEFFELDFSQMDILKSFLASAVPPSTSRV